MGIYVVGYGSKSEIAKNIKDSAKTYESEMQDIFKEATASVIEILENFQEQYGALNNSGVEKLQPSLSTVKSAVNGECSRIINTFKGKLVTTLAKEAVYIKDNNWEETKTFFEDSQYELEIETELGEIANDFFDDNAEDMENSEAAEMVRDYVNCMYKNLNKL